MSDGIEVRALRYHKFRDKEYNAGDTYIVDGDQSETAASYVDSLRGARLALPVDEQGPNIIDEVPLDPKEAEPAAAKAATKDGRKRAASSTKVEAMTTADLPGAEPAKE